MYVPQMSNVLHDNLIPPPRSLPPQSIYVAKCNLGEVKIEAMQAAVFVMAAQTYCGAAR